MYVLRFWFVQVHLSHHVWWACRQNLINVCLPGRYGATCGDNNMLRVCSACALPSWGSISSLVRTSLTACGARGIAQPTCLTAFPLPWHCRSLWQAALGSWNRQKTDIMEKIVFCWFSFLIWLTGGSEKCQGGVRWELEHGSVGWGQCTQLGNHTQDWHWPGMSCTSDQSQHFIFLTGYWHHLSTGCNTNW